MNSNDVEESFMIFAKSLMVKTLVEEDLDSSEDDIFKVRNFIIY
jgi:hypothetical protein